MASEFYVLRHKSTNMYMPQAKGGKGYTRWFPGSRHITWQNKPRLFSTYAAAIVARAWWAMGSYEMVSVPVQGSLFDDLRLEHKDRNRSESDLEVVKVTIKLDGVMS